MPAAMGSMPAVRAVSTSVPTPEIARLAAESLNVARRARASASGSGSIAWYGCLAPGSFASVSSSRSRARTRGLPGVPPIATAAAQPECGANASTQDPRGRFRRLPP